MFILVCGFVFNCWIFCDIKVFCVEFFCMDILLYLVILLRVVLYIGVEC